MIRDLSKKNRIAEERGLESYLLDAEVEQLAGILERADASAIAERHKTLAGNLPNEVEIRSSALPRSIDVQDHQLIHFFLVEDVDRVDWIADIFGFAESRRFHESAFAQKEAGDQAGNQHGRVANRRIKAMPKR